MKKITLLFSLFTLVFCWQGNAQADCANAVTLTPGVTQSGDSAGQAGDFDGGGAAPTNPCDANYNDDEYWFEYTAAVDGESLDLTLSAITNTWAGLFVIDDCPTGTPICVASSVNTGGTADLNVVTPPLTLGTSYKIFISNWGTPNDTAFSLDAIVNPPPSCTNATVTYTVVDDCAVSGGFLISVDITDMGTATDITVSDDQGSPTQAATGITTLSFGPYVNATDVVITVTDDDDGTCVQSSSALTQAACPPSNDDCANASAVACGGSYTGDTSLATLDDEGACGSGSDPDAPNVWYTFTGSGTPENVTLDLCASGYDTSIGVYTGGCGSLACVASNDDSGVCGNTRSNVEFLSDGTTTYYIVVEGWNTGSVGAYQLDVTCVTAATPPANDDCANAVALTLNVAATAGDNTDATAALANPTCDMFGTIADVWYSFTAPAANMNVSVVTTVTTADEASIAVYDDCALTTELGCSAGVGGNTVDIAAGILTPGATYYVQVWNDGTAAPPPPSSRVEGTFTVAVSSTLGVDTVENENAFTYFPNPVKNTLTLKAQNNIQNVSVYNMLGQEVIRTAPNAVESHVNMNALSDGAYFVQVTINDVTETIRIIKR